MKDITHSFTTVLISHIPRPRHLSLHFMEKDVFFLEFFMEKISFSLYFFLLLLLVKCAGVGESECDVSEDRSQLVRSLVERRTI